MVNSHVIEGAIGSCAIVFAFCGVLLLLHSSKSYWDPDQSVNIALASRVMFLLTLNLVVAVVSFRLSWNLAQYFGFLVTYTGKAFHFILMGFYTYPRICQGKCHIYTNDLGHHVRGNKNCGISACFKASDGFETFILVVSFAGVATGVILLLLRFSGLTPPTHQHDLDLGQSLQFHIVSIFACVASCGMILYATFYFHRNVGGRYLDLWMRLGFFAEVVFVLVAGIVSAWSSVKASSTVGMLAGFLYDMVGRGIFYIGMGFYLVSANHSESKDFANAINWGCGGVAIVVGIVYLVLRFFAQAQPVARDQLVQLGVKQ